MKKMMVACSLAIPVVAAHAQYTGPSADVTATKVQQLLEAGTDDQPVKLRGHILKHVNDEKYQFADKTGQILVEIDHKHWPAGQPVNDASTVELTGEYDKELVGTSHVEVREVKIVQ
jgi:uncharacterized protein (TIGR00156 family)